MPRRHERSEVRLPSPAKITTATNYAADAREKEWQEELEGRKRHQSRAEPPRPDDIGQVEERERSPLTIEPAAYAQSPSVGPPQPTADDAPVHQAVQDPLGRSLPEQQIAPIVNIIPDTYSEHV